MAINLICKRCRSNLYVRSRVCKNCGYNLRNTKSYRVVVKGKNGRRISKVVPSISLAKKLERKLKTQFLENSLFGINKIRMIDDIWEKYLSWAKQHKKRWMQIPVTAVKHASIVVRWMQFRLKMILRLSIWPNALVVGFVCLHVPQNLSP